MTKQSLVSIIIPCYNYGEYLSTCVESVFSQSYKSIEVIIINDGSTDNTHGVAEGLQQKYPKLKYVKQENQGIVRTRNRGIDLAKGDYLVQLDADDWIGPSFVESTVDCAMVSGADIVYTQAEIFGRVQFVTKAPKFNLEHLKHDGYMHASALVKKEVFKNRRYDEYLDDKGNEDWDLFLDACLDGATAMLVDEPLLYYRKHSDRQSRADEFEGTKKELLVRHHVLSKQNHKHPEKMWYFSPYIEILKKFIDNYELVAETEQRLRLSEDKLASTVAELQRYKELPIIRLGRWTKSLLK